MAQTRTAGSGPIPPAKKDDSEDVAWALSTAEAMFARGDRGDALKWLRRAAESASEAQADDRALELAKAAAELASVLGPSPSAPPPPPAAVNAAAPPPQRAPMPTRVAAPPPPPAAPAPSPAAPPPPPAPAPSPAAGMRPKPPVRPAPAPAVTPVAPRIVETRRPRRSRPEIQLTRPIDEVTQVTTPPAQPVARRRRASRPPAEETNPPPTTRRSDRPTAHAGIPSAAEVDAWPTESRLGDLETIAPEPDEKTRIGVPAYDPNAPAPAELPSSPVIVEDPSIRSSQAVRVVVWRAADGVHIAPAGTRVNAITVDAVLVALDPSADLTAWLTGK
ncbi:MAG TPA: hypothetical protein VMI75_13010 [Polyangiaceae bacterium]|nr:hypothetical protein [Polyangiaceae bacterium]